MRSISRARDGRGPATPAATPAAAATRTTRTTTATTTGTGRTDRAFAADVAGLLLRQVIPAAAVVHAATAGVIRRMPPAPPTGTPRLGPARIGGHRGDGTPAGPDVPRSADPNWSFTGARGRRALSGAAIGDRAARPITLTGTNPGDPNRAPIPGVDQLPAVAPATAIPGPGEVASRRGSLVDLLPASLFERARAGLADPTGGASPAFGPLRPTDARPREVAVTSPIDDGTPRQQQIAEALTPREWDELVDIIVDRLEDRVLDELARRGRRFTPGVF
ncbi:hypothetical protein [Nakamurella sp.]|uniref:hypothetical protein n=1 Tax=Nakamurella sp. TaxID=1869182 RepID=UPI003B3A09A2